MDLGGESGPRVVGRYLLCGPFAEGGIATVHFGRILEGAEAGRVVAIKKPHERYAGDPECATLFREEGRLAMRIHHPNVVPMLDVVGADKELLLVMEYVEGETLGALVRQARKSGARIPPAIVGAMMKGMLEGLQAAHETRGDAGEPLLIVHRDVSPHNVIVGVDGRTRVLDFGVAKAVGRVRTIADEPMTGKLAYMAPEQVRGASVDHRADLYGAAILLWEALTQKRLFTGETDRAIIMAQLTHAPAKPSSLVEGLPEAIDAVTQKGLAKTPEHRYGSAAEMAEDVERALGCASEAEVAAWLKALAERSLSRRAERHREVAAMQAPARPSGASAAKAPSAPTIEIAYEEDPEPSPLPRPAAAPRAPDSVALPTPTELVLDVPAPAPKRRRIAAGAFVVFAVAAAVALTLGLRSGDRAAEGHAAQPAGEPLPPPSAAPAPPPSAVPASARVPVPSASASASAAPPSK